MATQNEALRRKYNNLPPAEKKKYGSFAKYSAQHSSSQGNDKSNGKENRYAGDAVGSKSSGKPKTSGSNSNNRMAGDKVKQEAANSYNQSSQATGQQQNNARSSSGPKGYISEKTQNDPKYAHKPTNQLMRRYRSQMEAIKELEAKPSLTAKEQEQLQRMKAAAERMKSGEYTKPTFENKSQTDQSMINLPPGWKKNPEGGYIDDKGQRKSHIPNKYYGPNGGNGNQPKPDVNPPVSRPEPTPPTPGVTPQPQPDVNIQPYPYPGGTNTPGAPSPANPIPGVTPQPPDVNIQPYPQQPEVKVGAPPTQGTNWKDMGWTTPDDNPDMVSTQAIVHWVNTETGEKVTAPNGGYQPPAGSAWKRDIQEVNFDQPGSTGPIVNVPTTPPPTTYPGVEVGNPGDGSSTNIGEDNAGVGGNNEVGDMFNQDKEFNLETGGGSINNWGNLNSDLSVNFNYNDMFNATAGGGGGSNVGANWNMGDSIFKNNMNAMATIGLKDNQDARNTGQFMNTYMQGLQMSGLLGQNTNPYSQWTPNQEEEETA